jgi:hypothetical protein
MSRQQFTSRNDKGQILTFQKSGSTASFDPTVTFSSGSRRVSWRLDNGIETKQFAGNSLTYTGFTSDSAIRTIQARFDRFSLVDTFTADNDNLYGNLDLSNIKTITNYVFIPNNPNLTGITFPNTRAFTPQFQAYSCNLTGNLDLTPISGLGGSMYFLLNPNLTGVTHSPSSNSFSQYQVNDCNITGNLDLTPLSGLGGIFRAHNNTNLTGITHSTTTRNFTEYWVYGSNLTGNLNLTPLTKLGGVSSGVASANVLLHSNTNLSGITLPNSTQFFKNSTNSENGGTFSLHSCNLDYINFTNLSGATLVSGSTQGLPRISLRDNNMSTTDVNHILVDFSGNTSYNPTGWSNVNLNISGTNGAPDSSSGGYNGIGARNFLTGSPYNWTITHT